MSWSTDKAERAWTFEVKDPRDDDEERGYAGRVLMTNKPPGPGCTVIEYRPAPGSGALGEQEWRQCGMPIAGTVDLERAGLRPFGCCFAHLMAIASDAPYIPIRLTAP